MNHTIWSDEVDDFWKAIKNSDAFQYIISNDLQINSIEIFEDET